MDVGKFNLLINHTEKEKKRKPYAIVSVPASMKQVSIKGVYCYRLVNKVLVNKVLLNNTLLNNTLLNKILLNKILLNNISFNNGGTCLSVPPFLALLQFL